MRCVCVDFLAEYFLKLFESSYRNLHEMFLRTYGQLYEQNADIFIDLFTNLRLCYDVETERHHHRGNTDTVSDDTDRDVRRSLDRFFVVLMRRMLTLLNQHDAPPTDEFINCVSTSLDQLRPFGDVPSTLSLQLHRAFITARAFVVGLATGSDAISTLSKVCRLITAVSYTHLTLPTKRIV